MTVSVPGYTPADSFFASDLTGPRLVLRPYVESRDFDALYSMIMNPEVTSPMGIPVPLFDETEIRRSKEIRRNSPDTGDWTIFLPTDSGEVIIGETGIARRDSENHVSEIFIALSPDHAGLGYGRETFSLLIGHIFAYHPIETVRTRIKETNVRACGMVTKLGFYETGYEYISPDPSRGFTGGIYVTYDCRLDDFKK